MPKKLNKLQIGTLLCALVLCAAFLLSAAALRRASGLLLDGDTSSEMVLSKLLHDEGALFSDHWHYSTEIRVISTKLTTAPLFSLFSDWTMVRFASILLWHIILLLCWLALSRELKCRAWQFCLGGAILMLPFSVCYGRMVLFQGYYAPHIAVGFLLTALFLRAMRKRSLVSLIVLGTAAFLAGCCGVRHLMNLAAPLTLCFLWGFVQKAHKAKKLTSVMLAELITPAVLCVCCLLGFVVYSRVLTPRYAADRNYADRVLALIPGGELWDVVTGYLSSLGYAEGLKLFSIGGLTALLCAFCGLSLPAAAAVNTADDAETEEKRFVSRFFLCSAGVTAVVFLFVSSDQDYFPLYWLIPVAWSVPMLMAPGRAGEGFPSLRRLLSMLFAAALLVSGFVTLPFFLFPGSDTVRRYEGLEYQNTELVRRLQGTVDFLEGNGYDLGLGMTANAHWYKHVITEMTDGRIRMAICNNGVDRFLNDTRILSDPSELTEHRFFAVVEKGEAEEEFNGSPYAETAQAVYADDWFTVFVWEDPVSVFGSICRPEGT